MRRLMVVLVLFASLFTFVGTQAQTPDVTETPESCSPAIQTDAASITFVNYTARPVSVFWVESNCQETSYATLKAGDSYTQATYVGHVWRIRDQETNDVILEYAAQDSTPVTIPIGGFAPTPENPACTPNAQTDAITLTFVNYTSRPVALYWVGYDCKQQKYATLKPGDSVDQPTYVGHHWLVRDDAADLNLMDFAASDATNMIVPIGVLFVSPGDTCSSNSSTALNYTFVNTTSRAVDVVWVDQNCKEQTYTTLDAGQTYNQQTYEGHVWRLYDHDNHLLLAEIIAGQ